jgi:mannose-6-phosphate isomerase-like protein (cupin superfamily)
MKKLRLKDYQGEFFKIIQATDQSQIGVMTLKPGQDSGPEERHAGDQVVYVVAGEADIDIEQATEHLTAGDVITIAAGRAHHIYNRGTKNLFILSVYAPPAY